MKELLCEKVVEKHGAFEKVVRYWRGWFPELEGAILINGWIGKETKQEITIIRPKRTFVVCKDKQWVLNTEEEEQRIYYHLVK